MSHPCHPCHKERDGTKGKRMKTRKGGLGMSQSRLLNDGSSHDELLRDNLEKDDVVEEGVRNDKGSLNVLSGGAADRDAWSCSNTIIGPVSWCCCCCCWKRYVDVNSWVN